MSEPGEDYRNYNFNAVLHDALVKHDKYKKRKDLAEQMAQFLLSNNLDIELDKELMQKFSSSYGYDSRKD